MTPYRYGHIYDSKTSFRMKTTSKVETEQEIEESMAAITTTGLTQQMQELALETDIIETEEAEKILEECYPITTTAFISEFADEKLWVQTWNAVCNNPCKHYFLPKGKIGKLYVESLNDELNSFLESNSPSEKFLVYSSLILHCDPKIKIGTDVKLLIQERINAWKKGDLSLLVKSYLRCSKKYNKHRPNETPTNNKVTNFVRMMREGNVRGATRQLTDQGVKPMNPNAVIGNKSVYEILNDKHPHVLHCIKKRSRLKMDLLKKPMCHQELLRKWQEAYLEAEVLAVLIQHTGLWHQSTTAMKVQSCAKQ